ncbi:hypothetical protein HRbin19_00517 [bacterium HR19]|nr:hypothetical protein HRbin19_00517 [bacterium HR19]
MNKKKRNGISIGGWKVHFLVSLAFGFLTFPAYAKTEKEIFIENKCNKCHSVKAQEIEPLPKSLKEDKEIHDLSGVGVKRDADWIKKWLKKEVANEEGKKHKEKWKGSDEDLDTLANWLAKQKTEISKEEIKKWLEELKKKVK